MLKRAFCPACGLEESPVLIETPYYACPGCETITPRVDMPRERRGKYALAGTTGPTAITAVSLGTATLYDAAALTNSISTAALPMLAGDHIVVGIVTYGGDEATLRPDFVVGGVTTGKNADTSAGGPSDIYAAVFSTRIAVSASNVIRFDFIGAAFPVSAAVTVTALRSIGRIRLDSSLSAYNGSGSTIATSGTLPDNIADGEIAFGYAASQNRSSATAASWSAPGSPFVTTQRAGTDTAVNDCTIEEARLYPAKSPTIARATIVSAVNVGMAATYRSQ